MTACKCGERNQPLPRPGLNERPRQWFITRRNVSCSAFNGYREAWSDFSHVHCRVCGAYWKTKAPFVERLPNCEFWPEHNPPKMEPV